MVKSLYTKRCFEETAAFVKMIARSFRVDFYKICINLNKKANQLNGYKSENVFLPTIRQEKSVKITTTDGKKIKIHLLDAKIFDMGNGRYSISGVVKDKYGNIFLGPSGKKEGDLNEYKSR